VKVSVLHSGQVVSGRLTMLGTLCSGIAPDPSVTERLCGPKPGSDSQFPEL
jgi:hypothetical protein